MKCRDLIRVLEEQASPAYACEWDNVGLLVGDPDQEIHKVYIALDATDQAIEEAVEAGADFLLTHHPMIFHGIRRITGDDFIGRRVIRLIRSGISYYAMHTNFDVKGMADLAADRLQLRDRSPLEVTCVEEGIAQGIGRVGTLPEECSLAECVDLVKQSFDLSHVAVFGDLNTKVSCLAVCPGSGKSNLSHALAAGAQVYLTGDIDHHTGIDANAQGLAVIDAGHYGLEHIFVEYMKAYLNKNIGGLEVAVQGKAEPFQIV